MVPGSRGGYGLAQWTGPRRNALESYAAEMGTPVSDPEMQLDFLVDELQGPEADAYRSLLATTTPEEAAVAFARNFLRPAEPNLNRRVADYMGGIDTPRNALADYASAPQNAFAMYEPVPRMMQARLSLNPTLNTGFF